MRNLLAVVTFAVLLVLPACASAPSPQGDVKLSSDGCGPVLSTTLTGIPVPETSLVADITTTLRYGCAP